MPLPITRASYRQRLRATSLRTKLLQACSTTLGAEESLRERVARARERTHQCRWVLVNVAAIDGDLHARQHRLAESSRSDKVVWLNRYVLCSALRHGWLQFELWRVKSGRRQRFAYFLLLRKCASCYVGVEKRYHATFIRTCAGSWVIDFAGSFKRGAGSGVRAVYVRCEQLGHFRIANGILLCVSQWRLCRKRHWPLAHCVCSQSRMRAGQLHRDVFWQHDHREQSGC